MKRKHLSLAIGCVLLSPVAWAQESGSAKKPADEPTTLGRVTVTARKREETIQDVPVAVTAFTAATLDKLNIRDISDLDAQVPNLTIYAARGSSSTVTAYIRGVGQSDPLWGVDPGVGIYLDDVYVARPQGALLDVFDVHRIEVLRGPQGTLYGKNTTGGAIKYISRGLPATTQGFAEVTAGNYNERDVKAAIGGSIGGSEGALRGRIAVASLKRDGFGNNLVTGEDVSDKDIAAYRLNLGAYISDDLNVQFAADWMNDRSGVRGAQMLAPNPLQPVFFRTQGPYLPLDSRYDVRNGMPNVNDTRMQGASSTVNWHASDNWSFKYVLAKRESHTETNIDFDTTPSPVADVKAFYRDQQVTNELQANYDAGAKVHGVMGLYSFDGQAGGRVLNNFFNLLFGDTQGKVITKSRAAYADWTFDLSNQLSLDVGARYTDEEKHAIVLNRSYSNGTYTVPTRVVADFNKTISFKNVSPKVALNYRVTPDIMLYGVATRGFKSGGYNIRAQSVFVPRSAEPFDDESVDSYEAGSKMGFLDQRLFLNFAMFHNKYKNIQLSVFTAYDSNGDGKDDAFFGDFTNAGSGTVNGAELEYQWLPTRHWAISGNVAWLDAKFDRYMYKGVDIASQQAFTNAPRYSGALNVEYRTDLGRGGDLTARVGYSYQADVVATTEITRDPLSGVRTAPITQGGYGLLGAGLIWNTGGPWQVSLQGSNLADQHYLTTGYVIPSLGVRTGFYGAPRQYSLGVRYSF